MCCLYDDIRLFYHVCVMILDGSTNYYSCFVYKYDDIRLFCSVLFLIPEASCVVPAGRHHQIMDSLCL